MPGRELNASACEALVEAVVWDDPRAITILTVIAFIDLMVIVGNCLVIAAVYISSKLRSVTNLFIVSLAVADLMVGLAVLPFSATWEVFKVVTYNINLFLLYKDDGNPPFTLLFPSSGAKGSCKEVQAV